MSLVGTFNGMSARMGLSYAKRLGKYVGFNDVLIGYRSTPVGYLMPNPVYAYIKYIWFAGLCFMAYQFLWAI